VEEEAIADEGKDILTYRVKFASGHEVVGMPGTAYGLRSKQGRVVVDEAAFTDDFDEILKAAKALLIWGGQLSVISTHNGEDNAFNTLIKRIRAGKENKWSLHRVTFDGAIRQGLYKKICVKNGTDWSAEKEKEFVDEIRDIYKDNIDEELNVVPARAGARYFSRSVLDRCSDREIPIMRLTLSDEFLWKDKAKKAREIEKWFNYDIRPVLLAVEGRIYAGMDFARSGDLSLLWLLEEADKNTALTRMVIEVKNCPFAEQKQLVFLIAKTLEARDRWGGIAIDGRGNGQNLAEDAMLELPGSALCVMETPAWYAEWFPRLRSALDEDNFTVPDNEAVKGDFSIVTLKNGVPVIPPVRTQDRDLKGRRHGDGAAGALLALFAWHECGADPPPVFAGTGERADMLFEGY
jgi:phage FluMu gp28-like protein